MEKKEIKKMQKNTKIKIRNRGAGSVGYTIPDMNNFHRKFAAGERKELPFEEVQKLTFIPGGEYLLQHYLVIENPEARDEILGTVELEYNYTTEDIKNLLLHGSMDQLLDCLDFAPLGVIEELKKIAVEIELADMNKRKAIQKVTGFNISKQIEINADTDESKQEAAPSGRRVAAAETATAPTSERRYTAVKK